MPPDPIWGQLLLQALLIAINAFFASTEIAIISLNDNRIRRMAESGDRKAAQVLKLVEAPSNFLSTIQIGITLGNALASAFAAERFAGRLADWLMGIPFLSAVSESTMKTISLLSITAILSFFMLIFGELVPKRVAMQKSEAVARMSAGFISGLTFVTRPIIALLAFSTNSILRLLRLNPDESGEEVTEEGIRLMMDIGEEKGAIEATEKEMIDNIFEFNNLNAKDAMTHRTDVSAIWIGDSDELIIKTIEETGLSRFPVYDEDIDDIVGILSTRTYLLNAWRGHPKPLRELLRPAYFVPESVRTDVLFRDMQTKKIHMAVVVDEYGGTSGLITMEDLLEEIVGNIYDEFDPQAEQDIQKISDDEWRVAGSVDLETLGEALGIDIPAEIETEYDTLGGLIFSQLSVIPDDGSQPVVEAAGMRIMVHELTDRRVEWAIVSVIKNDEADENVK